MTLITTRKMGFQAEQQAEKFLRARGLKLVAQNFQCRYGEIDLIMQESQTLVFVEVRSRQQANYGKGLETVDYHKQNKLIKAAKFYLQKENLWEKIACRFDVLDLSGKDLKINWIKDAFWLH